MRAPIERLTLIALRSRRTAFRLVMDFLHRGKLKGSEVACGGCGEALDDARREGGECLCRRCAERVAAMVPLALECQYDLAERAERKFAGEYFGFIVFMIILV